MTAPSKNFISWILRVIPSIIMLQTLFFKFTASAESVYIFSELGLEPWGRILTGIMELIASALLLIPRTKVFGALLGAGIMAGAILSHLLFLGIAVQNDGGLLFIYGVIVLICCSLLIAIHWQELWEIIPVHRKIAH